MKYRVIKDGIFPINGGKKGCEIELYERKAAEFVKKGWVEPIKKKAGRKKTVKSEEEEEQTD